MVATVEHLLAEARRRLAAAPFAPPAREAGLLLAHTLGLSEAQVLARADEGVPAAETARFVSLLERRLQGEPFAYLTGEREFHGRAFQVDRRVLIPRPETEHLVEAALRLPLPPSPRILDIGTGSGCLAITLAAELPAASVVASDSSLTALAVARANARRHRVAPRVRLVAADLDTPLRLRDFDLVLSNPPYIAPEESAALSIEILDFEPHGALFAAGGDSVLRRLMGAAAALRPGAWMALEIGRGQLPDLERQARSLPLRIAEVRPDLAGVPRVLVLERRGDG
jgi:release factor glutamine methyltransferase